MLSVMDLQLLKELRTDLIRLDEINKRIEENHKFIEDQRKRKAQYCMLPTNNYEVTLGKIKQDRTAAAKKRMNNKTFFFILYFIALILGTIFIFVSNNSIISIIANELPDFNIETGRIILLLIFLAYSAIPLILLIGLGREWNILILGVLWLFAFGIIPYCCVTGGIFSGILLIISVISCAITVKSRKKKIESFINNTTFSAEEQAKIDKALEADKTAKKQNETAKLTASQELENDIRRTIVPVIEKNKALTKERSSQQLKVDSHTILSKKDKRLEVVNFIIDKLESRRADTIKEALIEWDKKQAEIAQAFFEREMRKIEREANRQAELDAYMAKMRRESEEREVRNKTLRELEEINKKLNQ